MPKTLRRKGFKPRARPVTPYSFPAVDSAKGDSGFYDEVYYTPEGGGEVVLSKELNLNPYPPNPNSGKLFDFLTALRKYIATGGSFRVNEHGRAFTTSNNVYIGTIPFEKWFPALTARS
jgi:hypothetical protein